MCNQQLLMWLWWALGIGAWWATYSPILQHLRRWIPARKGPHPDLGDGLAFFIAMLLGTFVWGAGLGFSDRYLCEIERPSYQEERERFIREMEAEREPW